jgi:hypothetical protein
MFVKKEGFDCYAIFLDRRYPIPLKTIKTAPATTSRVTSHGKKKTYSEPGRNFGGTNSEKVGLQKNDNNFFSINTSQP